MADIRIDYKKVKDINSGMPGLISTLEAARRNIGLMRWRIPEEVQSGKNIRTRLDNATSEMERAERLLRDIKNVVDSGANQYAKTEKKMNTEAEKFL